MARSRARCDRMQHARAVGRIIVVSWLACCVPVACTSGDDDADAGIGPEMDSGVDPDECTVTAPTECPDPPVRYADVEPIFQERCVICHLGAQSGGPWALTSYSHASMWSDLIRGAMLSCAMPPSDAGIDMPDEERELILAWIRCRSPE